MPDLQTEIKKVLQHWENVEPIETTQPTEQPKGPKLFAPTNNVTKATFNFIRDNSGCSRTDAVRILVQQGHKKSSVSSLIGQMLRQGLVWKDSDGLLRPNSAEYTPIKSARTIANREKKAKVVKPAKTFKVKTSEAAKGITSLVATPVTSDRVQEIMDTINLPDAKRLHRALNEYFGSV